MTQKEACAEYMKLLKATEELTTEQSALARESFNEGWLQCELALSRGAATFGTLGRAE